MDNKVEPVFVWRDSISLTASTTGFAEEAAVYGLTHDARNRWSTPETCPFCTTPYRIETIGDDPQVDSYHTDNRCSFCGFYNHLVTTLHFTSIDMRMELGPNNLKDQHLRVPVLRSFDLNDTQLSFSELGTWIAKKPKSMYSLTPRRFEELVSNIFSNIGFDSRLTQSSKDGGVDIYLLDKSGVQSIVQVKRNRHDRKIGVELIDQVRGLKLRPIHKDVTKAFVVTSSSFTAGAKARAKERPIVTEFEMELIDCEQLLRHLGTYHAAVNLSDHVVARLRKS